MSNNYWKTNSSKRVHQNPWFSVYEDDISKHNNVSSKYFVVHLNNSVFIVPITKDKQIYLIKQFRYPNKNISWEVPAGAIDSGEDSLKAAKRELLEETGLKGKLWQEFGSIHLTPALIKSKAYIYTVSDLSNITEITNHDEEAILDCQKFTESEIKEMIQNELITDGPSIAVLSKVFWTG